jgi:hypothetical protein
MRAFFWRNTAGGVMVSKQEFASRISPYNEQINKLLAKETELNKQVDAGYAKAADVNIAICNTLIYAVSLCLAINTLSEELQGAKNQNALEQGRKLLLRVIVYLEAIVTNYIDVPYADYESSVGKLSVSDKDRWLLVTKLGLAINMVTDAYKNDAKLKWTFVELRGRFATITKNIVDLRQTIKAYLSSTDSDYALSVRFLTLIKKLLSQAAKDYYARYSSAMQNPDDIRFAIYYLSALKRIHTLLNENEEVEMLKKRIAVWENQFEIAKEKSKR